MSRPPEVPIERTEENRYGDGEQVENHPAFGMIQISRVTGGVGRLFGSHLNNHNGAIRLRISRGTRRHHLNRDWYSGHLVHDDVSMVIEMSHAQFAEAITSLNMGDGVPCTIRRSRGEAVPYIPQDLETEQDKVSEGFQERMNKLSESLQKALESANAALDKKTVNKKDREVIRDSLRRIVQEIECNIPFVLDSFIKSTTKVTAAATAEIDGFMTMALQKVGLEHLKEHFEGVAKPALSSGEEGKARLGEGVEDD